MGFETMTSAIPTYFFDRILVAFTVKTLVLTNREISKREKKKKAQQSFETVSSFTLKVA